MSKKKKELSQTRFLMNAMIHSFNSTVIIPLFEWMQNEVSKAYPDYQKLGIKNIIFKEPTDNPNGHMLSHSLENAPKEFRQNGYSILRSSKFSPRSGFVVSKRTYNFPYGEDDKDLQGVNAFEKDVPLYIIEFLDKEFYTSKYGFRYWRNLRGKEKGRRRLFCKYFTDFHEEINRYNEVSFFYFSKLGILLANIINDHYGKDICYNLIKFFDIFKKGLYAHDYERISIINWWRPYFSDLSGLYSILDEVHQIHSYILYLDSYVQDFLINPEYCFNRSFLTNLIGREMGIVIHQFMKKVLSSIPELDLPFIANHWTDETDVLVHDPYYSMSHYRQKYLKENEVYFGLGIHIEESDGDIFEIIYNHVILHDMCANNDNIHYDDLYASIFLHESDHIINYHTPGLFAVKKYFHKSLDDNTKVNLLEFLSLEAEIDDSKIKDILSGNERQTLIGETVVDNESEYEAEKFSILLRQIISNRYPKEYQKLINDFNDIIKKWVYS